MKRERTDAALCWVRIGTGVVAKWPEWKRRVLVLKDGGVLVPAERSAKNEEAAAAIKGNCTYAIFNGGVLVDAAWAIEHRPDDASRLRVAVGHALRRRK